MHPQLLLEYALNALWQVPLVVCAAWLFARAARLGPHGEHRLWLAVLTLCVLLPARGLDPNSSTAPTTAPTPVVAESASTAGAPSSVRASADRGWASAQPTFAASPTHLTAQAPIQLPFAQKAEHRLPTIQLPLTRRAINLFSALYAAIVLFATLRVARGYLSAHRLLAASTVYALDPAECTLWHELTQSFNLTLPSLRSSSQLASPVVVGILRPTLLLPENFRDHPIPHQRAAIAHELAHIQRRDTLVQALCHLAALPLVWHPVLHPVDRRIARTREMICDLVAARHMRSEVLYARCLLALAQAMLSAESPSPAATLGLFRTNKLEERIMQLTAIKPTLTRRQTLVRRTAGAAILASAIAAASAFHLAPVLAQSAQPAQSASPATPPPAPQPAPSLQTASPAQPSAIPQAAPAPTPPAPAPTAAAPAQDCTETHPCAGSSAAQSSQSADSSSADTSDSSMPANFGIAHGNNAHVIVKDGQHLHRWTGADGQPFWLVNDQAADLTPAQQRAAEAEYRRMLASAATQLAAAKVQMASAAQQDAAAKTQFADAEKQLADAKAWLNSPEFKAEIDKISSGEVARQMEEARKEMAAAQAQLNSPEFKAQLDKIANGEVAKEMQKAQSELAQMKSQDWSATTRKQIDEALAQLNSGELQRQLDDAQHQLQFVSSPEFEKRMKEAERRLEDAQKLMQKNLSLSRAEQQRRLDQANQRLEDATRALAEARKSLQPTTPQ